MNVKLIGEHKKDSRACRDGLALTLNEMMAEDKSICYVDCDLMGCINTGKLLKAFPAQTFNAGIAEQNAMGVASGMAATGLTVFAGPTEGTALGNLMVQFIHSGDFADLAEARAAIRRSFEIKEYQPE